MKRRYVILAVALAVLLVVSLVKDAIIKTSVERGFTFVTGLPLKIKSFKVGILKTFVGIKGIRLLNPKGYADRIMLDMPEVYVDYDLAAAIKSKIHLEEMRLNMEKLVVVKNSNGELNLDSLKVVRDAKNKKGQKKKGAKAVQMQIDKLELKIGKVIYKDYSKGGKPSVREFDIDLNKKYKHISDPGELVSVILVSALAKTAIASITGFDLRSLSDSVADTLAGAEKIVTETASKGKEVIRQTAKESKEIAAKTIRKTEEAAKKTTEGLKKILASPFESAK